MGKNQNQNEKLTAALTSAGENLTKATADTAAALAKAAQDYADARTDLANGYQVESSGLIKSNGNFEVADEDQVKAAIAAIESAAKTATSILKAVLPKAARKTQGQRPQVARLVWSETREPVMAEDTNLGVFANAGTKKLRGEGYREAIGDRLAETCIVNIETGEVITEGADLEFAPAPGRKGQG